MRKIKLWFWISPIILIPLIMGFGQEEKSTRLLNCWWKMEYTLYGFGSSVKFTDYIHIEKIIQAGQAWQISAVNGVGEPFHGWIQNNLAVLTQKDSNHLSHTYMWQITPPYFGKHLAIRRRESPHHSSWQKLKVTRLDF